MGMGFGGGGENALKLYTGDGWASLSNLWALHW